jgi:ubiquinone/menaquinone biosynthesis C-methylase UbiE
MRLITSDDILETYLKARQRGLAFIFSKFSHNNKSRTQSAFSDSAINTSNWWIIPKVVERWNEKISGEKEVNNRDYLINKYLIGNTGLRMLSLGCGTGYNEIEFSKYNIFDEIIGIDLSKDRVNEAKSKSQFIDKLEFICTDIEDYKPENKFDIILFNMSLHHFKNVEELLNNRIINYLNKDGYIIINEYVGPNRLQYPKKQINEINDALTLIPKKYRQRFKSNKIKNRISGSGIVRMVLADPSECIDSETILPSLDKYFTRKELQNYGGNILMPVLKDISHHFVELNNEKKEILNSLFEFEDNYLKNSKSDFVFAVYQKEITSLS